MRKLSALFVALALALASPAHAAEVYSANDAMATSMGTPVFLGVIIATTTKNNNDTATPFTNTGEALKGMLLLVQCDTAAYLLPGTTSSATVTTANGVKVAADERVLIWMTTTHGWLAALAVSGTASCKTWRLTN